MITQSVQTVVDEEVVLKAAAEKIKKYGWVQGTGGSEKFGFCIVAAIYEVSRQDGLVAPGLQDPSVFMRLVSFNDDPARTKEEVIDFLTKDRSQMV